MIKAKHHFFIYPLFKWLTRFLLRRNFYQVKIKGEFEDNGKPVLVISNHISWGDGFWIMYLNLKVIKRKFHFMMFEKQLKKHWYFNYAGGYSVRKNSRSILQTIQYTSNLLQYPSNMVFMFPQGKIMSMHQNHIVFESGIEKILAKVDNEIHILFVANFIEYLSHPKPGLYIHIENYKNKERDKDSLQQAYNIFYSKAHNYHKNISV